MKWHNLNLLYTIEEVKPKKKMNKFKKFILFLFILFIVSISLFIFNIKYTSNYLFTAIDNLNPFHLFQKLSYLSLSRSKPLKGESEDRINILLIGMGGKDHDGAYLADTLIIGSIKPSQKKAALFSIPRDLVIPIPKHGWRKINTLNAIAESKKENGAEFTSKVISNLLQIPIHYYVRVDFAGFQKAIDILGGLEINVDRTLDDPQYPIAGKENVLPIENRYEHLYIPKGKHLMNGELALKYARSRHAKGIEGSDFARAKRQQKILEAFKQKLLSLDTFTSPKKISYLISDLKQHLSTNLKIWEIIKLYKIIKKIPSQNLISKILDNSPNGLLVSRNYDGAYVLEPKNGDFEEIRFALKNIFNPQNKNQQLKQKIPIVYAASKTVIDDTSYSLEKISANTIKEKATIEIQNGTLINGLARKNMQQLKKLGLNVIKIGNAQRQDYLQGIIYDYTDEQKNNTQKFLEKYYKYNIIKQPQQDLRTTSADFLIILGP